MARYTEDREDLLREATALVPRVMLRVGLEGRVVEVFAGFRNGDALSIYFDSDPVLHFNSRGELRRAFADGCILKAEHGKLVSWKPRRTATSVTMARHELSATEEEQFGERMLGRMQKLRFTLANQKFTFVGQFPAESDGFERLREWLESLTLFTIAALPNVC